MTSAASPRAAASPAPAYLRQPSVAAGLVAFVADDDLWTVPLEGGTARRVTDGLGEPAYPALSPDAAWIAWTGRDEHHAEVWLAPAAGGPARRLTWLGSDTQVRGWLPDGRILFVSNHGTPFLRHLHLYAVAPEGGLPQKLPFGPANHLALAPGAALGGACVLGRNTIDPARWKRYRGGTAGHLWVDVAGSGRFERLTQLQGNLSHPMWVADRLWYVSDVHGTGNLHSCRPDGSDERRHTHHEGLYARHAATDGRHVVYACGAELWCLDTTTSGGPRRLAVEVPAARTQAQRRFVPATPHLESARLHPKGHSVAVIARGQAHAMPLWEGAARRIGPGSGVRSSHAAWLADGQTLVTVEDDGEAPMLVLRGADEGTERRLAWPHGRVVSLQAAPAGTAIAIATHRQQLWRLDTAGGEPTLVDTSPAARIDDLAWSPCGRWLAYAFATDLRRQQIRLHDATSGHTVQATPAQFRDHAPAFDPEGRFLYFLSIRTFDPVYDAVVFDMGFPRAGRPYLIALKAEAPPPFEAVPKGFGEGDDRKGRRRAAGRDEAGAGDAPTASPAPAPAPTVIDLEGLAGRVAAFPVREARYEQIAGVEGGKVIWSVMPVPGAHGRGGHTEKPGRIELFRFETGSAETLIDGVDGFTLAADATTLLVRTGDALRAIDATKAPFKPEDEGDAPSRRTGHLDLGRLLLEIDPPREWAQMLREVWCLQRDQFWTEDMSGNDWPAAWQRYAALLPRVATRAELSDLVWELQGELGTSHAYESGGDHRKPPTLPLGQLAAAFAWDEAKGGWRLDALVEGDTWDATSDSPLRAVGVEAKPGERLVAIGGRELTASLPPQALLVGMAGRKVAMTIESGGEGGTPAKRREVIVKPLADEAPARYRAWVEGNRAKVHAASAGRVGYLHVPDMMSLGFAEFHRAFAVESDRDALLVDVRFNRGGHVSQLLLEKLARRRIAWGQSRWGRVPEPYPETAPAGPVVALVNEHAGSDGDIFSHGFKLMRLGRLLGQRSWGGVIGIWPRHALVDGSSVTQPEYSFWFSDVGWGVENHGTDPDAEVPDPPHDAGAGIDRQLEAAVAEALAAIEREGVRLPAFGPRPNLAPPKLVREG